MSSVTEHLTPGVDGPEEGYMPVIEWSGSALVISGLLEEKKPGLTGTGKVFPGALEHRNSIGNPFVLYSEGKGVPPVSSMKTLLIRI